MKHFIYHNLGTAPIDSVEVLTAVKGTQDCIPNIFAVIAESSPAIKGLAALNDAFVFSSFNPEQQQVILLATSTTNECVYCVAGHTAFANNIAMQADLIVALRNQMDTSNASYNILVDTVRQLIIHKGRVPESCIENFLQAGFSKAQFFELILGICVKTFTNYVSNALSVELDEAFKPFAWQRPSDAQQLSA